MQACDDVSIRNVADFGCRVLLVFDAGSIVKVADFGCILVFDASIIENVAEFWYRLEDLEDAGGCGRD